MRLNELLEKESLKSISIKTMISENNIKRIVSEDYSELTKAKALGFLSILEREYPLDLKDVRHNALAYFEMQKPKNVTSNKPLPHPEESKKRSKLFPLIIVGLIGYASWYFFTQFDKKTLNNLLPFKLESNITDMPKEKEASIFSVAINEETTKDVHTVSNKQKNVNVEVVKPKSLHPIASKSTTLSQSSNTAIAATRVDEKVNISSANRVKSNTPEVTETGVVELHPVNSLWFGVINMRTGKKDHFSIRKPYTIDLSEGNRLVATSPAPFSLVFKDKKNVYNGGKAHYFMFTPKGIVSLDKNRYIKKGGYKKW